VVTVRRLAICAAAAAALLAACSQDQASQGGGGDGGGGQVADAPVLDEARQGEEAFAEGTAAYGGTSTLGGLEVPAVGPAIIKTADLAVEVKRDRFDDSMAAVSSIAARHGGFIVSSTRFGEGSRNGSVVIRVPSAGFEAALDEIRGLGRVDRETVSGEDVGQEFVDLQARLRNLHAQEAVLLRLFDDAQSVTDTIRIQSELSGIQLEIERLEGRLRYLQDRTDLATISASLAEDGATPPEGFGGAFDRAVDGLLSVLSGLVVLLGYALPIAMVAIPLWLVGRTVRRRLGAEKV
jgi:hypothetical protein